MNMRNGTTTQRDRRRAFRKALLDEGLTAAGFARQRLAITPQHLSRAFTSPDVVSARVHTAIDRLIAKYSRVPA